MAEALSSLTHSSHCAPNDHECNVPSNYSPIYVFAAAKDQPQHRPLLPKLNILAVDPDEELQEEWEAEDDVKGGPLDPREVKKMPVIKKLSICGTWRCTSTPLKRKHGREQDAKPFGFKWIDTNKGSAEAPRLPFASWCVCKLRREGVEPIFSAALPLENSASPQSVSRVREDVFRVEDPFLITAADVSRTHLYADAVSRRLRPIARREPQGKAAKRVWEITKDDVRFFECCPTLGRTPCSSVVGGRIFPGAWLLCAISSMRACKHTFWCMVTIFQSGPT